MHDQLVAHGRMDNFLRLAGRSAAPQKGPVFSDSDIYKWMEAVGFALQTNDHPELRNKTDAMIREVVAVQEAGGYLNTYYVADKKSLRMNYDVQTTGHELYNIGHLLQGAIAIAGRPEIPRCLMLECASSTSSCFQTMAPARVQRPSCRGIRRSKWPSSNSTGRRAGTSTWISRATSCMAMSGYRSRGSR